VGLYSTLLLYLPSSPSAGKKRSSNPVSCQRDISRCYTECIRKCFPFYLICCCCWSVQ
uniref:Uncharacterized protein n=1 Tax=Gallus gallus TaxID=9031 RepID=A0A8V0Z473_CHICK